MSEVQVDWRGAEVKQMVEEGLRKNMLECLMDLGQKSSEEAPVLMGDLRGNYSVVVDESVKKAASHGPTINPPGGSNEQIVGYGGYGLPYALPQHEDLIYNRLSKTLIPKKLHHPMGGKAKFLEDPFNANKSRYIEKLGKGLIP